MYVYEEIIDGKKLTEIINEQHENVKYLPGIKLPPNVVSYLYLILNWRNTLIKKKLTDKAHFISITKNIRQVLNIYEYFKVSVFFPPPTA